MIAKDAASIEIGAGEEAHPLASGKVLAFFVALPSAFGEADVAKGALECRFGLVLPLFFFCSLDLAPCGAAAAAGGEVDTEMGGPGGSRTAGNNDDGHIACVVCGSSSWNISSTASVPVDGWKWAGIVNRSNDGAVVSKLLFIVSSLSGRCNDHGSFPGGKLGIIIIVASRLGSSGEDISAMVTGWEATSVLGISRSRRCPPTISPPPRMSI